MAPALKKRNKPNDVQSESIEVSPLGAHPGGEESFSPSDPPGCFSSPTAEYHFNLEVTNLASKLFAQHYQPRGQTTNEHLASLCLDAAFDFVQVAQARFPHSVQ